MNLAGCSRHRGIGDNPLCSGRFARLYLLTPELFLSADSSLRLRSQFPLIRKLLNSAVCFVRRFLCFFCCPAHLTVFQIIFCKMQACRFLRHIRHHLRTMPSPPTIWLLNSGTAPDPSENGQRKAGLHFHRTRVLPLLRSASHRRADAGRY